MTNEEQKQHYANPLKDLSAREITILMICVIGLVWLGMYPQTFLDVSNSSMQWLANSYIPVHNGVDLMQQAISQLDNVEIQ